MSASMIMTPRYPPARNSFPALPSHLLISLRLCSCGRYVSGFPLRSFDVRHHQHILWWYPVACGASSSSLQTYEGLIAVHLIIHGLEVTADVSWSFIIGFAGFMTICVALYGIQSYVYSFMSLWSLFSILALVLRIFGCLWCCCNMSYVEECCHIGLARSSTPSSSIFL